MYIFKLFVILGCYVLSWLGILVMYWPGFLRFINGGWFYLMLLLVASAAIAHACLSVAWLEGRRLGRRTSLIAGLLGCGGLAALPVLLNLSDGESLNSQLFIQVIALEALTVLPSLLLAAYLLWYHARPRTRGRHPVTEVASNAN